MKYETKLTSDFWGNSFLSFSFKLSHILLEQLTLCVNEIFGDHQCELFCDNSSYWSDVMEVNMLLLFFEMKNWKQNFFYVSLQ
jgi:hypothetical protein